MQENKIVKRIPTNLVTKTIITSSAEYESNKEYTDEDANIYEKYLQAITNVSIDINNDIEKIKALEDNILEQYNKNVELEKKMEQETEKFAKQANTAIEDYNSNAETKTEEFNTNAKEKTDEFNSNATEKETEISDIADVFDANVEEKTNTFNSNVETKTTEFNNNSNTKTEEFNNNSTEKINAFNSNAEEKIADYNKHVETLTSRIAELEEETEDLYNALDTEQISENELYIEDAKSCRILNTEISGMYKQETTTGKNLLEVVATSQTINGITFTINKDKTITANGTANGNSILILNSFDFQNEETYILNGCPKNGGINSYKLDAFGQSGLSDDIGNGIDINIGGQRNIRIVIFAGNSVNNLVFKPMIIKGSQATDFEPYTGGVPSPSPDYPQAIEQVESVNFVNTRKNILPSDFIGKTITSNASLKNIKVKPGKDYYMTLSQTLIEAGTGNHPMSAQHFRKFIDKDGKVISSANFGIMTFTSVGQTLEKIVKFTIPQNCVTIELDIGTYYSSSAAIKTNYYQLEEGSTATEYEPYQNQTINIDLQGNKLCAISDTIKDKLLIDRNGNVALQKNVLQGFIDGTTAKSYITKLNDDKYVCAQMKTAFTDVLLNSRIISNLLLQPKKVGNRLALR